MSKRKLTRRSTQAPAAQQPAAQASAGASVATADVQAAAGAAESTQSASSAPAVPPAVTANGGVPLKTPESEVAQLAAQLIRMESDGNGGLRRELSEPGEGEVIVNVPKAYRLRLKGLTFAIKAGPQHMQQALADHWYSVQQGVVRISSLDEKIDAGWEAACVDAAPQIIAKSMTMEYAVNGIAFHYKLSTDAVQTRLEALITSLEGSKRYDA